MTILDFIARAIATRPDRVAVEDVNNALTYAELDARANGLAARLTSRGVGPDKLVAICTLPSVETIVAILGVLKAGGAFVLLDVTYPPQRIAAMLADCGSPPVLVDSDCNDLPVLADVERLPIGNAEARGERIDLDGTNLAYVVFTSGSTGRPRGVASTHAGLTNLIEQLIAAFRVDETSRVLQFASLGFDAVIFEVFTALAAGATLCLEPRRPGHDIAELLARRRISVVLMPPSLLRVMSTNGLSGLRTLVSGGEACSSEIVKRWAPGRRFVNAYGPSECTVIATLKHLDPDDALTIGRAIDGIATYVLDDTLSPVTAGGVGELYLAGCGLARGYLGLPAVTAERFVPDPRGTGTRMYRTGDLVRLLGTGELEYVGRTDHQVKLRGFRIELGEIENVLRDHGSVRDAVVLAREDVPGNKRLVAYVILAGATPIDDLRRHLGARLPEYMVPSAFVLLDSLPMTSNQKVDRNALPPPVDDDALYVAPRTHVETVLVEIWREVLGVDRVGIDDQFFARGGHSLSVIELVARIDATLGVGLAARLVFENPTVRAQAELVDARRGGETHDASEEREIIEHVTALTESEVSAQLAVWSDVNVEPTTTCFSATLTGERRELFDRLVAQHRIDSNPARPLARRCTSTTTAATFAEQIHWDFARRGNFPTLSVEATAFAIRGPFDVRAMERAIASLVARQAALRTVFTLRDDGLVQTVQERGPSLSIADLAGLPPNVREQRAAELFAAIQEPHDVSCEVFRAQVLRMAEDEHLLYLAPHHIVVDGFSWSVLEAELATFYRAYAGGHDPNLPPLTVEYRDFTFWQTTLEERPVGRQQLAFWETCVADYDGLELPADKMATTRGAVGLAIDTYENGALPFVISEDVWEAVTRSCARLACTPYAVIATAFALLLTRWSGRNDVCIMTGNFHRNRPGVDALVGNFVTPYPLRMTIEDDRVTLEDFLQRCHRAILVHRENGQVAPRSALGSFVEWSRYNLNYLIETGTETVGDFRDVDVRRHGSTILTRRTTHDLGLFVRQTSRGLRGNLVFNAERFSRELVSRAASRLAKLVSAIASKASTRVVDLPRLP